MHSSIPFADLNILPPLVQDYVLGKDSISFLTRYPFELSAFGNAIADKEKDKTDRKTLVEVLNGQYSNIPTSQIVSDNIQSLLSENTFTVTAAHQPCLFMGPLYNIYKISCAINLGAQLKKKYPEFNFVPVFWLGSEDHDAEELNHTFVNGTKVEWKGAGTGAAGRWATSSMQQAIDELKLLNGNPEILTILENGLKKYESFGRFTQYFVNEIFKGRGLVVLDQDDAQLKRNFADVIKDEVINSRGAEVLKDNIEFLEKNYKAQAVPRDINFFYLGEGFRERIVLEDGVFNINNTSLSFSKEALLAEIDSHPERFSPNVIFRPLFQEIVLPNLAFIGGAGELSYWLELKPLFDYYNVNYPMQVMRNSAVIINPSVQKKIEKLNLKEKDFFGDVEQLINRYVQATMSADLNLKEEKKRVIELYESVIAKAETADATLKNNAVAERQKAIASLENLEAKMLKAEKRKQETSVNQIRVVHSVFFSEGSLQERKENFAPFYTPEFISLMVNELDAFSKSFKLFFVDPM